MRTTHLLHLCDLQRGPFFGFLYALAHFKALLGDVLPVCFYGVGKASHLSITTVRQQHAALSQGTFETWWSAASMFMARSTYPARSGRQISLDTLVLRTQCLVLSREFLSW